MNKNDPKSSGQGNNPNESGNKTGPSFQNKERDKMKKESSIRGEDLLAYAKSNKEHTIAYALLALGLLFLLFFNNLLGGLIIGMVAGYYFDSEIVYYIRNIGQIIGGQDQFRYVILTAVLLGLFIAAPGIFIGALIVSTFKQVLYGDRSKI